MSSKADRILDGLVILQDESGARKGVFGIGVNGSGAREGVFGIRVNGSGVDGSGVKPSGMDGIGV